ncbi:MULTISPECIES: ABC transporter substrate-binding protein [unclassified Sinorhizobium]|uniref:ABC transporter substrate-binding protein n=1 Tax=unclassified Sinorhizobium TaxID=2613772 RepID=UPI003524640B
MFPHPIIRKSLPRALTFALAALAFGAGSSATSAAPTVYPLTITNCGRSVTFEKAPERVVSVGQAMTEILLSLGLADRITGTAVWFSPVLKQFEAENSRIKRLADNDPSFESVVGTDPELVAAEFEWHVGPNGSVGSYDQFSKLGINSYVAPADCAAKDNSVGGDGVRKEMLKTDLIYQEIAELAQIFDVQDRGDALIAGLKEREAKAIASVANAKAKGIPVVFWFSSKEVDGEAYMAGRNGAPAYIMQTLGAKNVITTNEEWPMVGWETIAGLNPDIIVIAAMDRRRYAADDPAIKVKFLKTDPVASKIDAVEKKHIIVMDSQAMSPSIRIVDGIETLAEGIRKFGLAQ